MNNEGWVKLHRKILDNPISTKPEYAWLWTVLLLLANHDDNKFIFNGKEEIIKRGQVLTGREKLSKQTGIKQTSIENILKFLEKNGNIGQQKTNKFRLITVINYDEYQEIGQQSDNKVTTKRQQMDTNKNVKNVKNNNINTYVGVFNEKFGNSYKPTIGRENKLKLRLKNFTMEQILKALENLSQSPWHRGQNDKSWIADPDFLIRSDEQVDKWLNYNFTSNKKTLKTLNDIQIDDITNNPDKLYIYKKEGYDTTRFIKKN